jgi:hypothetical protein
MKIGDKMAFKLINPQNEPDELIRTVTIGIKTKGNNIEYIIQESDKEFIVSFLNGLANQLKEK